MVAPAVVAAGIGALGSVVGGLFGRSGARDQNRTNLAIAREQMAFEERMANTEIQRRVADLRASGLNPMLSIMGMGAASSPSPPMAQVVNEEAPLARGIENAAAVAASAAQIRLAEAQARKIGAEASILETQIPWSADSAKFQRDELEQRVHRVKAEIENVRQSTDESETREAIARSMNPLLQKYQDLVNQGESLGLAEKKALSDLYETVKGAKGLERFVPLILSILREAR